MAVILYKPGNTIKVSEIPVDFQICNPFSFKHLLGQGWFYTPEECYAKTKQKKDNKTSPEEVLEEEATETEEGTIDEIRVLARDAGISHWHTKSIERLEKELKEIEDAKQPED